MEKNVFVILIFLIIYSYPAVVNEQNIEYPGFRMAKKKPFNLKYHLLDQITSLLPKEKIDFFENFDPLNFQKAMQFEDGLTIKNHKINKDTAETQCQLVLTYKQKIGFKIEFFNFFLGKKKSFKMEAKSRKYLNLIEYNHNLGFSNDIAKNEVYHQISQDGQLKEENDNFRKEITKILKKIIPLLSKKQSACSLPLIKEYLNWAFQSYFEGYTYNQYILKLKKKIKKKSEIFENGNYANLKSSFIKRALFLTGPKAVLFKKVKTILGKETLKNLKISINVKISNFFITPLEYQGL